MIEKEEEKIWYFLDFKSDSEQIPDPSFHEADPRIRIWIHVKIKRIRNTYNLKEDHSSSKKRLPTDMIDNIN